MQLSNPPYWRDQDARCWYVDLVAVASAGDTFTVCDQYIDVIIATDGRPYRMLDLDDFAEAIRDGALALPEAIDALVRWQRFLDRYVHADRFPDSGWTDFPPAAIEALALLPAPLPTR